MKNLKRLYWMQNVSCVLGIISGIISALGVCLADSYSLIPMLVCLLVGAVCGIISYIFWVIVQRERKRYQRVQRRYLEKNHEVI